MLLELSKPKIFSDVIGIISELVLEVKIKVNKEGMSIIAVDPANVAMVIFKLPSSAFDKIEVEEESLGVNLESLKAVLRRCSPKSNLILKREENLLKVEIIEKIKREFTLTILDLEGREKPIPNLEFSTKVEMDSIDFLEAIEDCAIVSDSCGLEVKEDMFEINAKGPLNSAKLTYSSDEVQIQSSGNTKSRYSLEYLQKMIKASKLCQNVIINIGENYPLRLDFNTPIVNLSFILAPRVETD